MVHLIVALKDLVGTKRKKKSHLTDCPEDHFSHFNSAGISRDEADEAAHEKRRTKVSMLVTVGIS